MGDYSLPCGSSVWLSVTLGCSVTDIMCPSRSWYLVVLGTNPFISIGPISVQQIGIINLMLSSKTKMSRDDVSVY